MGKMLSGSTAFAGDLSCVQEATCAQAEAGPAAHGLQLQWLWQQQRAQTASWDSPDARPHGYGAPSLA